MIGMHFILLIRIVLLKYKIYECRICVEFLRPPMSTTGTMYVYWVPNLQIHFENA